MAHPQDGGDRRITILIDADATPRDALRTADKLASRFGAVVVTVSSINHEYHRPLHIAVDAHPQAVDMEIIRRIVRGRVFVVVTQDYGLAALVLCKGARAVSPRGLVYTEANIDRLLLERELHARQRRATGRSRGPKARSDEDVQNFERAMEQTLFEVTGADTGLD